MRGGQQARRVGWVIADVLGYGFGTVLVMRFAYDAWAMETGAGRLFTALLALALAALLLVIAQRQFGPRRAS